MRESNSSSTIGFMALIVYAVILIAVLAASFSAFWRYNNEISKKSQAFYQESISLLTEIKEDLASSKNKSNEVAEASEALVKQEKSHQKFMADYYKSQSDWLNRWLTVLGMILALMGIMAPLLLIRYNAEKKRDFERLEDQINETHKKMQKALDDVNKKKKEMEEEIKTQQEQMKQDLIDVKEYIDEAKESEKQAKISQLFSEGWVLIRQKKYEEAIAKYENILSIEPNNVSVLVNLAGAYSEQKKYEQASEYLNEALQLEPERLEVLTNLGNVSIKLNKYDEGINFLKKSLIINQTGYALYNLTEALILTEDFCKALSYLKEFFNIANYIFSDDKEKWLGVLQTDKHKDDEYAKEIIKKINELRVIE